MGNYSFYCKHCGAAHSFDTKEDKQTYEKYHYVNNKKYPGLKICRNLVRTTYGTIMRAEAAMKIDEENLKAQETVKMNWDDVKKEE